MGRGKKDRRHTETTSTQTPFFWERISQPKRHAVCLLLLCLTSVAFFAPIHFKGKTVLGSDIVNWRAAAQSVIEYEEETGEYALWAANLFGGMPAYMIKYRQGVPQIDTVVGLLRRVIWPSSHFILLLVGTYLLAFFITRNEWASVLSAFAFGFTTYIPVILVAGHNTKFIALCFAPWLLLAFMYGVRRSGILPALLFAVALAAHLRASHPQITYYVLFVMLALWIGEGVSAIRSGHVAAFARNTGSLLVGGLLAALMIAQPYLAQFEYKAYTIRGSGPGGSAGGLAWDYAMQWSQGFLEMITLLIADAFGGSESYWGPKLFTGGPHYVTGVVLFLAVVGAVRESSSTARSLGVAAVLILLFALGSNLEVLNRPMFEYFPLFDAFRVPETWLAVFALVAALLAGIGIQSLIDRPPRLSLRAVETVAYVLLVGVVLFLAVTGGAGFDYEKEGEKANVVQQIARANDVPPQDPRVLQAAEDFIAGLRQDRADKLQGDAWRTFVFLVLSGISIGLFAAGRLPRAALPAIMSLLVLIDLWGVGRRYLSEKNMVRRSAIERNIPQYDFDRYIVQRKVEDGEPFRVLSLEGSPTSTARPSYFYESLSGYHGAKLRVYQDFLDNLLVTPDGRLNLPALRMLNTRFVVASSPVVGTTQVFRDERTGLSVYEIDDALPRAFFVDSVRVVESSEEAWTVLTSEDFEPERVAVLEEPIDLPVASPDSVGEVQLADLSPRHIKIATKTSSRRLLVLSEVFYPAGWKATIDGVPVDIHRVDYLLRGVVVPEGTHTIEFVFDPSSHRVGLWVASAATILVYGLIAIILVLRWVRRRKPGATETGP